MEHAVPLAFLISESNRMFTDGKNSDDVADFLKKNLKVVEVTRDEAKKLDYGPNALKSKMQDGWDAEDHFARLKWANIRWTSVEELSTTSGAVSEKTA